MEKQNKTNNNNNKNKNSKNNNNKIINKKTLGIVGFGEFCQFITKHIKKDFKVMGYSPSKYRAEAAKKLNVDFTNSIEKICENDIILIGMPIDFMEETLNKMKKFVKKDAIILDMCSVKETPIKLMKEILPKTTQIIGTHPMFGQNSGKDGIEGLSIVLDDSRCEKKTFEFLTNYCEKKLKLKVFKMSPQNHDKEMAKSQVLIHFLGRIFREMKLGEMELSTKSYNDLIKSLSMVQDNSENLFLNIQKTNPYAKEIREKFIFEAEKLNKNL